MSRWRYTFADLVTDQDIVDLDLSDVSFDRRICQAGSFKATAHVVDRATADAVAKVIPREPGDLTWGPGRTVVHVDRDGELWGTYIIWSGTPQADDRGRITVPLQGASLESYLHHREIRRQLLYRQVGDRDIARDLIADMEHHAPIGIEIADGPPGMPRDRDYRASEAETYGTRLEQLAEVIDGPEWMIRVYRDAQGVRRREFVVTARLGQDSTDHAFTQPGNVISWSYPADATSVATSWQTRGDTPNDDVAAESEPLLSGIWEDPRYRAAGWPVLESTVDYQGVTEVDTLDAYAAWWAQRRSGMLRIPQVEVRIPPGSGFSPDRLGDTAAITLVNDWFPLDAGRPSFSHRWRVVGVEVTPATRGASQDRARLIFEEPTGHPAATTTTAESRG